MGNMDRRDFMRGTTIALAGLAAAGPLSLLSAKRALGQNAGGLGPSPYGRIRAVNDRTTGLPLLHLPAGFTYRSFGWTWDTMTVGGTTPAFHDGMDVVQVRNNRFRDLVLVRNHEVRNSPGPFSVPFDRTDPAIAAVTYNPAGTDPAASDLFFGGTTNIVFRRGKWIESRPSLAGTTTNCAGGGTPWGSWLTSEEFIGDIAGVPHGYVFEVPGDQLNFPTHPVPLTELGRFSHEALAVDPETAIVYETEDDSNGCGLYRFIPNVLARKLPSEVRPYDLEEGGRLEMLAVCDADGDIVPNVDLRNPVAGQVFRIKWVSVQFPDVPRTVGGATLPVNGNFPSGVRNVSGPFAQGWAAGGATFFRGEGCWFARSALWFDDTGAGPVGEGAIWRLDPEADPVTGAARLTCIYVSQVESALDNPDNLTVSPRGGILICEDGSSDALRLIGLRPDGRSYEFARNAINITAPIPGKPLVPADEYTGQEWAGACFDPTGRWLFVNIQTPGITFAITGPWARGNL
ncbi:MAG: PhoX family protein [Candidatus Rokubacteria bacterium]|nr:PhoX family protein [Candidatus Rokubacteria bacterium]